MVRQNQGNKVIGINVTPCRSVFRRAIALPAGTLALVFSLTSGPVESAPTIYNMDRLLSEPHPFAVSQSRSSAPATTPEVRPAPASAQQRPSTIASNSSAPSASKSDDDIPDLEDLELEEGEDDIEDVNDPLESINRVTFEFNEFVNQYLLGPIAKGYNAALPEVARDAISNFLDNISAPVVLANDLLQAEFERGFTTATRIMINSTAGIGGFIDVAEKMGFEEHKEDFGQTLAVWGVGEGFYLVLPLLGPSNPRDALGQFFVDSYFDPLGYYLDAQDLEEVGYGLTAAKGLVTYAGIVEELDRLRETSIDFYGTLRSLYRQRREAEIKNRSEGGPPSLDTDIK